MRRSTSPELLDRADAGASSEILRADLRGNFRDIARFNRWTRANALMLRLVAECVGPGESRPARCLDVGVGGGDFIAHARSVGDGRHNWVGLDLSPAVLEIAREAVPDASLVCGLAQRLPFADGAFDVVTSAQTLHHLAPDEAVAFLRECARVARTGVVVADLARSRAGLWGVTAMTRLTSRNRLTLHDAPLSVRRAYTPPEALRLATAAGWRAPSVRRFSMFRFAVCARLSAPARPS